MSSVSARRTIGKRRRLCNGPYDKSATTPRQLVMRCRALLAANPELKPGPNSDSLPPLFPALTSTAAQALLSRWQRIPQHGELGTLDAYLSSATDIDAERHRLVQRNLGGITS